MPAQGMPSAPAPARRRHAVDGLLDGLAEARSRTLALVGPISDDDLETVHSSLMSPLVWDLGHIAAFEDLWLAHRMAGEPMLRPDLADVYDAFETPRAGRGDLPYLRRNEALAYLDEVRERSLAAIERDCDPFVVEMVVRHEHQHNETMLQTLNLARLDYQPPRRPHVAPPAPPSGLDLIEIPGGEFTRGAGNDEFAYDNERPQAQMEVGPFLIGRHPVTNGDFADFVDGGGYDRRDWWSDEGWAWRTESGAQRPLNWIADRREWRLGGPELLDPAKAVVHVSFHEADAFARAHGRRLPTETEWEKAASLHPAEHPNLFEADQWGTAAPGEGLMGNVWEWTSSHFTGYPGFTAHPYPEYSEVFFGDDYRVLRGGSWATSERVTSPTFRNWDHPQRRQIFSGLRLADNA